MGNDMEAEWSTFSYAWFEASDLAWIVTECLAHPIGGPANVLAGHFVWYDPLCRAYPPHRQPLPPDREAVGRDKRRGTNSRRFYAQSWRYDDRRLRDRLDFRPNRTWQQTVAETVESA